MPEIWRRAAGFLAYEVSTSGRVRRRHTKKLCVNWPDHYGYASVSLQRAGRWWKPAVHLLVWRTFRGPTKPRHEIDHRDRKRFNPRLRNLQQITIAQNRQRAWHARGRSQYRGVYWNHGASAWSAQCCHEGQNHHLGYFRSERAAARARDRAARRMHGRFAVLNFGRAA